MDIHVICGGKSTEHEISLRSARSVINNLDKSKYNVSYTYITKEGVFVPVGKYTKDIENPEDLKVESQKSVVESVSDFVNYVSKLSNPIVIPCMHGTTGEDGQIQGFLKTLGLNFVGNDVASSAVCFDKALANDVMEIHGIAQAKYIAISKYKYNSTVDKNSLFEEIFSKCGENVYVKPSSNGSSIGVSKATRENIREAIEEALKYDKKVLIEQEMPQLELEVSVVGNNNPVASLPGSYHTEREIFDYTAKYHDAKLVRNVPHKLPKEAEDRVRQLAIDTYVALGCEGLARVDIFMDDNYNFFVNEINTYPGMTPTSLSAGLWEVTNGTSYSGFLDMIINAAIERAENANS